MSGNRTLVTRVTGGYTHHYTNTEMVILKVDSSNSFVVNGFMIMQKKNDVKELHVRESNPGHPRDRRVYSPLY